MKTLLVETTGDEKIEKEFSSIRALKKAIKASPLPSYFVHTLNTKNKVQYKNAQGKECSLEIKEIEEPETSAESTT